MIVIPMAGLSRRFRNAGYELPKYMLKANGKTLFSHAVGSFERYFNDQSFLFIALDVYGTKNFIESECLRLGLKDYSIVLLSEPTRGQAETVYLGLKKLNVQTDAGLLIFNIDTFRPGFKFPGQFDILDVDGYLETFIGGGVNWSNVLPADESSYTVKLTAEKQEISKYCCTGIYYWRYASDFIETFEYYRDLGLEGVQGGEFYIAPMYNRMIENNRDIRYSIISEGDVIFCGTPEEYKLFMEKKK